MTADAALAAWDAGLCVIRAATDGTKRPYGAWRQFQATRPDRDTVTAWFAGGHPGMGVVCGQVSGGLEMIELEGRAVDDGLPDRIDAEMAAAGLDDLWGRILLGYADQSPSGGIRTFWRCPQVEGNLRLAADHEGQVLIETRGQGGFAVVPPSNSTVHPTGHPWTLLQGGFHTIAAVTPAERVAVLEVLRRFDEPPVPPPTPRPAGIPSPPQTAPEAGAEGRPGDEFNTAHSCSQILEAAGFSWHSEDGRGVHWTRPGKDPRHGSSATVWADDGTCTLFSTAIDAPAEYVDGRHQLDPWRLHVALRHSGNFTAAARSWRHEHPKPPPDDDWSFLDGDTSDGDGDGPQDGATAAGGGGEVPLPAAWDDATVGATFGQLIDGRWLHCDQLGGWLHWTGKVWRRDHSEGAHEQFRRWILRAGRQLFEAGADIRSCSKYRSKPAIDRAVGIARRLRPLVANPADFDQHPQLLGTGNGVLDLTTGQLRPHNPELRLTRSTETS